MDSGVPFFSMIDNFVRCTAMRILHKMMQRGWKKSSVLKLTCWVAHGMILLGIAFLALMARQADVPMAVITMLNVAMIGIYVVHSPLSAAVDQEDDPLITRFSWKTKLPMAALVGTLIFLFFHTPARVRSAGIPVWSFDLANLGFLSAAVLIVGLFYLLEVAPLGHQPAPAKP